MLAMTMSMTALAIDVMLPAFPEIREAMGLPADSPEVGRLVTAFFLGLAVAQIPAGILSDRFGRKPILYVGLGLYAVGAIATMLAPSLGWMLVARFAWGLGRRWPPRAGHRHRPRPLQRQRMARVMSLVMSMFLLIPVIAPTIGALLLLFGPWQLVFGFCAAAALAVKLWPRRLPESLPPEHRRPLGFAPVLGAARIIAGSHTTVLLGLALTASMGHSWPTSPLRN